MSGHSKWATTKHKKAAIDAKRGKLFTKLGKLITIAARDGKSGDINFNPSLRVAVENAKAASMPKDNIDRAIQRGIGAGAGANIEEITYEAYAPGGVALLIECLTDNKNRTIGDIKALLNKAGGSLATAGSVGYLFKKIGQIIIDLSKNTLPSEDLEMVIIDSGAEDFSTEDGIVVVECAFPDLHSVRGKLTENGVVIESAEAVQIPLNTIEVDEKKQESIMNLIEKIEDLDDISSVFTNLSI